MAYQRRTMRRNTRRRPVRKRNTRITTRKVYNKKYKKNTAKILAPIAEGRKLKFINTTSPKYLGPIENTENWQVIIPETWLQMYRENYLDTLPSQPSSQGFTGKTLFSRFLNQQVKIKFETIEHNNTPVQMHVCFGWCKMPYLTALQSVGSADSRNIKGVLIQHDPNEFIGRSLAQMYNVTFPTTDPKQFKMLYNKEFQVRGENLQAKNVPAGSPPGTAASSISRTVRKDINYKVSWKPNTKYHMTPATRGAGVDGNNDPLSPDTGSATYLTTAIGNDTSFWTPSSKNNGDLWIPFFAMQVKNTDSFGHLEDGSSNFTAYPYHLHKNTHYFYDL